MAESFLALSEDERAQILRAMATVTGRAAVVLEKDVWVCWALEQIFGDPGRLRMAFKGGTSLSKVYGVIDRFSEDVDVTIDYRVLGLNFDPLEAGVSRSLMKKAGEKLRSRVAEHLTSHVAPHLEARLAELAYPDGYAVDGSGAGEGKLRVRYRSAAEEEPGYLTDSVLLEFGGRNITEPAEMRFVRPDLSDRLPDLEFPSAHVEVLVGQRTFWEKATLMHVECNRPRFRSDANRLSRHWYDLAKLADHDIGRSALRDWALLEDVIRHKSAFYHAGYADYEGCLAGRFHLLPDAVGMAALSDDYEAMNDAGMFFAPPPSFDELVGKLAALEATINRR